MKKEFNRIIGKRIIALVLLFICTLLLYRLSIKALNIEGNMITDVNIYNNTPVWKLALAVNDQKAEVIEKILQNQQNLVNYREPKYGATLLLWAVGMEKYKSVETLLKCGANPNIASIEKGTPLFVAASYSWVDREAKKNPKYVNILLRYGADPNINYVDSNGEKGDNGTENGTSPLMNSISCGIEKTKALVEAGADINHKTKLGTTAAIVALLYDETPEYAHYLIVEKNAIVSGCYYGRFSYADPKKKFFSVDLLRNWVFDLDSKEYKMKMEIINEFARQGVNYWDTMIPEKTLEYIKKRYPDTWEDYIKKY